MGRNGYVHHESRRGRGPGTRGKIRRITSGRSYSQPGLTATGEDLMREGSTEAEEGLGLAHEPEIARKVG